MKLTPVIRVVIAIISCIALVVVVGVGLLYPQYNKFTKLHKDQKQAQADLLVARTLLNSRIEIQRKQAKLQNDLMLQKEAIPDQAELSNVVRQLQTMAYENNHWMVKINNTYPTSIEGAKYNAWTMDVVVEGTWLDTITYLRDLRDMKRQVRITSVKSSLAEDLTTNGGSAPRVLKHWNLGSSPCRTTITCEVYYIPPVNLKTSTSAAGTKKTTAPAPVAGGAK